MNTVLLFVSVALVFGALVLVLKVMGKSGVIGFMGIATITANILICKSVNLLGMSATLGNVLFASNFLATDILTEIYGAKEAKRGVLFALISSIGFMAATQIAMLFQANEFDFASESMTTLFSITPRITLASVSLFAVSNFVDVRLYDYMRRKTSGSKMWLRNNLCTILCNGTENFLFYAIAFFGIMGNGEIISAGITATIIETAIALCDTPFLYLATKIKSLDVE